jgi:hypothetical protein
MPKTEKQQKERPEKKSEEKKKTTGPSSGSFWKFAGGVVAVVFGISILVIYESLSEERGKSKGILSRDTIVEAPTYGVPASIALPIIADGETGGRKPGGAKHFFDEAKRIPMRNPQDGPPGSGAVGKYQLNMSDPAVISNRDTLEKMMLADGRLKTGEWLDIEYNEEHNKLLAEYMYEKYGTRPWLASRDYWEPLLKSHALGQSTTVIVAEVPADRWSETYFTRYNGGQTVIECRCRVRFNDGYSDQAEIDWPEALNSSAVPKIVYNFRLMSRTGKPDKATIKF